MTHTIFAASVTYLNQPLLEKVKEQANKKFPKPSYVKSLWILHTYVKQKGKVKYSGTNPSNPEVKTNLKKEHENKIKRLGHASVKEVNVEMDRSIIGSLLDLDMREMAYNPEFSKEEFKEMFDFCNEFRNSYGDEKQMTAFVEKNQSQITAALISLKVATGKLHDQVAKALRDVEYAPMEKDENGAKQIKTSSQFDENNEVIPDELKDKDGATTIKADNEDGMLADPKPLGKNGGSMSYSGAKTGGGGGVPPADGLMPDVEDGGYTVNDASDDDDSDEDYYQWVQPLQDEISNLQAQLQNLAAQIQNSSSNLHSRISNVSDNLWNFQKEHTDGHLPKIQGAGQMGDVLKKLGMDKDYQIVPRSIYASDGSVKEINISLIPKK